MAGKVAIVIWRTVLHLSLVTEAYVPLLNTTGEKGTGLSHRRWDSTSDPSSASRKAVTRPKSSASLRIKNKTKTFYW